jgi:hypothetical protein
MLSSYVPLGLCSTCNHREVCTRRPGFRPPVLSCEEFDVTTPGGVEQSTPTAGAEPRRRGRQKTAEDSGRSGLCSNCDNRNACSLPKPPGGVWHCEEYV